ncbi:Clavaminate synthase-like protein [Trichocladium antarcticum]|uniref:Clavaminate synthase-like protein n=1 Tax=Trichocladium antarcticum TaxID=1450529 RepID=A0AAN6URJ4_9PEZI|nr:Clavaminate synthase-like protein [Trichocladium antarcticum]
MASTAKIPVIDISGDGDQSQVARDLVDAAIEHGFVYIKNTGKDISVASIDWAFEMSKRLFDAPLSEKQACTIQQNNRGWSGMNCETLDPATQRIGDFKEAFNFGDFVDAKAQQPIPPTIAADEAQISAFRDACYHLTLKLHTLLGIGLQVTPPDFFTAAHQRARGPSGTILRFLHYPPAAPSAAADIRAGAHSDYGALTLLFRLRGQPGLEVLGRDGATWSPVPVVPPGTEHDPAPPVLLNIGDLLSYWTGGLLRSTVHRVVFPAAGAGEDDAAGARYSIAYFCHPFGGAELGTVPSELVRRFTGGLAQGNPYAERRVLTADEHLQMRLRASYKQLYQEEK